MKHYIHLLATLLITITLISGCVKQEIGFWDNLNLVQPKSSKILSVKGCDGGGFCFLDSLAIVVIYDNPSFTFKKICEETGITTVQEEGETVPARHGEVLMPKDIIGIASDLGYESYLGYSEPEGNGVYDWMDKYPSHHSKEFSSKEEAIDFLKKAISSGLPVMATFDYNIILKTLDSSWEELDFPDHCMVVTGYNESHFYLRDPPSKNVEVPKDKFIEAWDTSKVRGRGLPAIYTMIIMQKKHNN